MIQIISAEQGKQIRMTNKLKYEATVQERVDRILEAFNDRVKYTGHQYNSISIPCYNGSDEADFAEAINQIRAAGWHVEVKSNLFMLADAYYEKPKFLGIF